MKPRLIELMNFKAPAGFHASVRAAAERRGISASEFVRQAIAQSVANNTDIETRPTTRDLLRKGLEAVSGNATST